MFFFFKYKQKTFPQKMIKSHYINFYFFNLTFILSIKRKIQRKKKKMIELKKIASVQMGILTDVQIRKLSVVEITASTLYEKLQPKQNSLNDERTGTCDSKKKCKTCFNSMIDCPGHFGHIELPLPIYHSAYIAILVKLFRSICHHCHELILKQDNIFLTRAQKLPCKLRFVSLTKHTKTKHKCANCNMHVPSMKQSGFTIKREWSKKFLDEVENKEELLKPITPQYTRDFMLKVNNLHFTQLGLKPEMSHPSQFIITALLIPPVIMRPSITFSSSSKNRGHDDLTNRLSEIVKTVMKLLKLKTTYGKTVEDEKQQLFDILQSQCSTYFNNESSSGKSASKKRSGLPEKSIMQRLKGKKGRFRGNLMGKRVNFSARSPISPDPNIRTEQIGIMEVAALCLTYPEHVTQYNIKHLQQRVNIGFGKVKGAHSIESTFNGQTKVISLKFATETPRLELGQIVHRYLQDDDIVLFNRQPSLRKKSIMAHRVKLMKGKTIRVALPATGPYNADFDGGTLFFFLFFFVLFFFFCC